jgi:hypothetical protein
MDRVPGYEPGGREFESLRARQKINSLAEPAKLFFVGLPKGYDIHLAIPVYCASARVAANQLVIIAIDGKSDRMVAADVAYSTLTSIFAAGRGCRARVFSR